MGELSQFNWASVVQNRVPPTESILDSPTRCIEVNVKWAGFLAGVIERLAYHDVWDGDDNTVRVAIDKIEQILLQLGSDCPAPGGSTDYVLQSDITLSVDATSYSLTNLESLDGKDLQLEFLIACTSTSREDFRFEINDETGTLYVSRVQSFLTSASFIDNLLDSGRVRDIIPLSSTPQLDYGFLRIEFMDWKNTSMYSQGFFQGFDANASFIGHHRHKVTGNVSKFRFWAGSDDIKADTQIRVYTRG